MPPVGPDASEIASLRAMASARFGHDSTVQIGANAGWQLTEDEPDFVQFFVNLGGKRKDRRLLTVGFREANETPYGFLTLFDFEGPEDDATIVDRSPFDGAFETLVEQLANSIGPPVETGTYRYSHRPEWPYSFGWWRLDDSTFALVQDERDIQFGMDVTLWFFPAEFEVHFPIEVDQG